MPHWKEPDWRHRLPGEQWLVMDSIQAAEFYLGTLSDQAKIQHEIYPNAEGIYAKISMPGQVIQHRIYVPPPEMSD